MKGKTGQIKLTGKLSVQGDTGCQWHDDCLTCPFDKCLLDLPPEQRKVVYCPYCRIKFRHSGKVELQKCSECGAELIC